MRHLTGEDREALLDVLDRVLTKGIVIVYGRSVVTSIETYTKMVAPPPADDASNAALIAAAEEYLRTLPTDAPHLRH